MGSLILRNAAGIYQPARTEARTTATGRESGRGREWKKAEALSRVFSSMFLEDLTVIYRTALIGILAYAGMVLLLRISGKRTLSKWNAFDFIVTIALGSMLANALLSPQTTLMQGLAGFAVLIFLQFLITWGAVRSKTLHHLIKARPVLLFFRGKYLEDALRKERVTASEVRAALRDKGIADSDGIEAVVLETDGGFSVIRERIGPGSTLTDVNGLPGDLSQDS